MWFPGVTLAESAQLLHPREAGLILYNIVERPEHIPDWCPKLWAEAYGRQIIIQHPHMETSDKYYNHLFAKQIDRVHAPWWMTVPIRMMNDRNLLLHQNWRTYRSIFLGRYHKPDAKPPRLTPTNKPNVWELDGQPFTFTNMTSQELQARNIIPTIRHLDIEDVWI